MLRLAAALALVAALAFVAAPAHASAPPRVEPLPAAGPATPSASPVAPGQATPARAAAAQAVVPAHRPPPRRQPREQRDRRWGGWVAFGAQSGLFLGVGAGLGLSARDGSRRPSGIVGGVGSYVLAAVGANLLGRQAERLGWRPELGHALAGLYPGMLEGSLVGGLIVQETGLEGRPARAVLLGSTAAFSVLGALLHRIAGERSGTRVGLFYALLVGSLSFLAPAAIATDRPSVLTRGLAGVGAAGLLATGLAPVMRW